MSIADYSPDLILFCGAFVVDVVLSFFLRITYIFGVYIDSFKPKRQNAQSTNSPERNYCLMQCVEKYYFFIKEIEWKELFRKPFN